MWPGFFDETSLSHRKTAHFLCAALWVYNLVRRNHSLDIDGTMQIAGFLTTISPDTEAVMHEVSRKRRGHCLNV
jgi:hypothetical protein